MMMDLNDDTDDCAECADNDNYVDVSDDGNGTLIQKMEAAIPASRADCYPGLEDAFLM